jgi:A/G-specific adenine glycosylase
MSATTLASGPAIRNFRRRLLRWYDRAQRPLPWRGESNAYRIWVSEIMLQQTRVSVVKERYRRFLRRFPTLRSLARARVAEVLAEWSGLGYYRRARALHQAAHILWRAGGKFPQYAPEWQRLPGIGRYTAAAIASIAGNQPVAAVDGNVERVLSRIFYATLPQGAGSVSSKNDLWRRAQELLSRRRPGDFNQAMMELGATVCSPLRPNCSGCPVAKYCAWHARPARSGSRTFPSAQATTVSVSRKTKPGAHETAEQRNKVKPRKKVKIGYDLLLLTPAGPGRRRASARCASSVCAVYLSQRPPDAALMPAMWELPPARLQAAASPGAMWLRHSITSTDYRVFVRSASIASPARLKEPRKQSLKQSRKYPTANRGRWIKISRLPDFPLTGLARKILRRASLL